MSRAKTETVHEQELQQKQEEHTWIGKPVKRKEDATLLRGRGEYVDNIRLPNTAHVALVRCPYAHARIVSIDTEEARSHPGVVDIITGKEISELTNPVLSITSPHTKKFALAVDRVRYQGEPVVAVVANDGYTAEDAAELVHVEYDPLPVVDSFDDARSDKTILHEDVGTNTLWHKVFNFGDVEKDFAEADLVIEESFNFDRFTAAPIETFRCLADYDDARGVLTIWSNFIQPGRFYSAIAQLLRSENLKIRLVTPTIGGAFGVHRNMDHMVLTSVASMRLKRPVKYVETRTEHLLGSYHSANREYSVKYAAKRDGTLLSCKVTATDDVGAYMVPSEPIGLTRSLQAFPGPYKFRSYEVEYVAVATNKCPSNSIRGYGMQPHCYMLERMADIVAKRLGLDPAELRARNLIKPTEFPYRTPNGSIYDSGDYPKLLKAALKKVDYHNLRKKQAEMRREGRLFGIGVACTVEPAASNAAQFSLFFDRSVTSGCVEAAMISIDPMGRALVAMGSAPHGQGHETTAAQVAAEVLGISVDEVHVLPGFDSASHPFGASSGTYGSRYSGPGIGAVYKSAQIIRRKMLEIASHIMKVPADELVLRESKITTKDGKSSLTVRRIAEIATLDVLTLPRGMEPGLANLSVYNMPNADRLDSSAKANLATTYASSAHIVTLEIDPSTGVVAIQRYVAVSDCGRIVNPLIVDGQTVGGIVQALGWVLLEQLPYVDGQLIASDFTNYLMPTMTSFPDPELIHVETPSPFTEVGAKGVGESSNMTAMAAAANALEDALDPLGIKIRGSHYHAQKLFEMVRDAKKKAEPGRSGK